jgi:transcriptional regulator with XRE-family HTH domain
MTRQERPRKKTGATMDRLYGARLRSVREERQLRQVDVAASLAMSAGGYSSVERGKARMFVSDIPRYAEALGVPPEYLTRRLGLCDENPADIANVLVNRFGPDFGGALVQLDRIAALLEHGDTMALAVLLTNTARKYDVAREQ